MREITTKVYKFEELESEVQDKIIEKWPAPEYEWREFTCEDAERVGIKIHAVDTYRGTISMEYFNHCDTAEKILKEHGEECDTYKEAKSFLDKVNPLQVKLERAIEIECSRGYRDCLSILQDDLKEEIEELENDFRHSLGEEYLCLLRQEYEDMTSREYILETIADMEFTENGELI